jgi:virulence-associated protein VagC
MKTNYFKISYVIAFVMTLMVGGAIAQNTLTWDKLGTKVVDFTIDRDVVTASQKEAYTALKIKVNNGVVNIHKVTVHFANGDTQDVKLPAELSKNNDGQLIDLKGNQRVIEKITFWYDTVNKNKDKAVVEIWAKK